MREKIKYVNTRKHPAAVSKTNTLMKAYPHMFVGLIQWHT